MENTTKHMNRYSYVSVCRLGWYCVGGQLPWWPSTSSATSDW